MAAARLVTGATQAHRRCGSMTRPSVHPSIYAVLLLPFGAVTGYFSVAIAYQLAQAGVSAEIIGVLIALYVVPQTWGRARQRARAGVQRVVGLGREIVMR